MIMGIHLRRYNMLVDKKGRVYHFNKWLEQATYAVSAIHSPRMGGSTETKNRMITEAYNAGIEASKGKTCFYNVTTADFSDDQLLLFEAIKNYFKESN
jgi:hypothetical protein